MERERGVCVFERGREREREREREKRERERDEERVCVFLFYSNKPFTASLSPY